MGKSSYGFVLEVLGKFMYRTLGRIPYLSIIVVEKISETIGRSEFRGISIML
jgi:hypothetical protein